jgi:hypothetical protein
MVIEARSYRRESPQYVFDGTASGEVEFVDGVKPYYWKAVPSESTFCLPQPARPVHQQISL